MNIHFIINPIAGSGNNNISEAFLTQYFDAEKYSIHIKISEYKKHAILLTENAIKEGAEIIVACGGDGTINEVASALVNTEIPLGIIPIGSGNGLASNLKIPKQITKAIQLILKSNKTAIDVGCVNNKYFFSNTGFGFDAHVIKNYEATERRSLITYVKSSLKSFKEYHKQDLIEIEIDETDLFIDPFLIFISNSNVMGYKMTLTPKASLQDGLLDVVIVPKLNKLKMLLFGLCMLVRKPNLLEEVRCFQTTEIKISRKNGSNFPGQIDGELVLIESPIVSIKVLKAALIILA